jgi:hypothetical protein
VRGCWPGEFDIVLSLLIKSFESWYVLQGFADLFERGRDLISQFPADGTAYIQHPHYFHLHGRDVLFVRGAHPLHPLRKGHAMARAHVYLSSFLSAVFISLKHLLPLTGGSCGLQVMPLFFSYVPWAAPPNRLPVFHYGKHLRPSRL